jgi:hypothetical protein
VGQNYLRESHKPVELPICRILEGGENETFEEQFGFQGSASSFKRAQSSKWKQSLGGWVDKDGHAGISGTPSTPSASHASTGAFYNDSTIGEVSAKAAAEKLVAACTKFFKDKQVLVDELAPRTWFELGTIAVAFEELHPKGISLREAVDQVKIDGSIYSSSSFLFFF